MKLIAVAARFLTSLTIVLCAVAIAAAQTDKQKPTPSPVPTPMPKQLTVETPAPPAANPADVASIDAITAAVYDVISGPAGKKRDWDRMRSLFVPYGRLIPVGKRANGEMGNRAMSVDGYIAHIFSTYESKHKADDPKPFARGINSIQVMNDGKRWWIVTVFWQGESA